MKLCIISVITLCAVFWADYSSGQTIDVNVGGTYYMPSGAAATGGGDASLGKVKWDNGNGFELQVRVWDNSSAWGVGGSVGRASWNVKDYFDVELEYEQEDYVSYGYYYDYYWTEYNTLFASDSLEGDVDLTTVGLSVFRRLSVSTNRVSVVAECGVRYVKLDGNVEGLYVEGDDYGEAAYFQTLAFDNCLTGLVALEANVALVENFLLFAGGGFQFDISKGKVKNEVVGIGAFDAGKTELQAFFARAGATLRF